MKLPEQIKSRHKIRDLGIVKNYFEGQTQTEIASRFKIAQNRVSQIIWENRELIKFDKNYEKSKRLILLRRALKKEENSGLKLADKRDFLDLVKEMRNEIEGEKLIGDSNTNIEVTVQIETPNQSPSETRRNISEYVTF